MITKPCYIHKIDENDIVYEVNSEWITFAGENLLAVDIESEIIGKPIWNFIDNNHVIMLYKEMLYTVRQTQKPIRFSFRCDSPTTLRLAQLNVSPLEQANHLEFCSVIEKEEAFTETMRILDPTLNRSGETISMCSYCKAVKREDEWIPLQQAMESLGLMTREAFPSISHGVCQDCYQSVLDQMSEKKSG